MTDMESNQQIGQQWNKISIGSKNEFGGINA